MEFLALPEEQAPLLVRVHQEQPLAAVYEPPGKEPHVEVHLGDLSEVLALLREQRAGPSGPRGRLFLREAAVPGSFVWSTAPEFTHEDGMSLDFVLSLAVEFQPSVLDGGVLFTGSTAISGREWYDDAGVDQAIPRRLKTRIERELRKLCPLRAAPNYMVAEVARGQVPRGLKMLTVHVSPGAADVRARGYRWLSGLHPKIEYEPLPGRDGAGRCRAVGDARPHG